MKKIRFIFLWVVLTLIVTGCHQVEEYDSNPRGTFEQLWSILDTHYCFFNEKDVDWEDVHARYAPRISDKMTSEELFNVCAEMLDELRDGHTNLSSPFQTSYYRRWWSDYPQNYQARLVEQYYFNFEYKTVGGIDYGLLSQNIGYMRYGSFSYGIGDGNLDAVLGYLATADGLIIDVRDNGGGDMTNVATLVARFITGKTLAGTICHKTGPGHDEFSKPYPYYYYPATGGHILWGKPVVVLCNRSTYSAANNFVSVMKYLPDVTIVGSTTGGGSGMPFSSELTNGWGVRFSASPVRDPMGELTEFGVTPTPGCEVNLDPLEALNGHDTMLDMAIRILQR